MVPAEFHDFVVAEAGVAATLIGLLFVATTVASDRVTGDEAKIVEQARASTALTAFLIPLGLSLVALLPGSDLSIPAIALSAAGLLFVAATLRRFFSVPKGHRENPRGLAGLAGFSLVTAVFLYYGIVGIVHPDTTTNTSPIAAATIASVFLGIDRAWALIGGRSRGQATAVKDLILGSDGHSRDDPETRS